MSEAPSPLAATLLLRAGLRDDERLFGVVDAAQNALLAFDAQTRFNVRIQMLFQGKAAEYMEDVAPYLVPISPGSGYLENWSAAWGSNAGILLTTAADAGALLRHLRKIFIVQNESGQEFFFRFYDPRVLRLYLPTCTLEELRAFFGPIRCFIVEGQPSDTLYRFTVTRRGLQKEGEKI